MGAGNSVIECALMEIQQTHEPKKGSRWRRIFNQTRKPDWRCQCISDRDNESADWQCQRDARNSAVSGI